MNVGINYHIYTSPGTSWISGSLNSYLISKTTKKLFYSIRAGEKISEIEIEAMSSNTQPHTTWDICDQTKIIVKCIDISIQ